jgi:amino acid transporter
MTAAIPVSGGELAYAYAVFGAKTCFAVGWFLALGFVVTTIFEALTSVWLIGSLLPGALGPVLYHAFGEPMRPGGLAIGLGGTVIITALNYFGVRQAVTTQDILTYTKIAIAVLLVACGLFAGHVSNLRPLFQYDAAGGAWRGIAAVLLTVPFWLSGFSLVAQVMEEKAPQTPARRVATMIVLSIIVSTVFYILLTLASASVTPWPRLVSADLPVARAFEVAFGSVLLARLVLLAALLGTITVWNGCAIAASRMLFALARAHFIGANLERIDPTYRTPTAAIVFVGVATAVGVLLGRTAIGPVINIGSSCFAAAYVVVCVGAIRLRSSHPALARPFRVPGGVPTMMLGALASLFLLGLSLQGPWSDAGGKAPVEWGIIVAWALLGVVAWVAGRQRRDSVSPRSRLTLIYGDQASMIGTNLLAASPADSLDVIVLAKDIE